jgi:hypothetical protein
MNSWRFAAEIADERMNQNIADIPSQVSPSALVWTAPIGTLGWSPRCSGASDAQVSKVTPATETALTGSWDLFTSYGVGYGGLLLDIYRWKLEAMDAGWDGYEAAPVTESSVQNAIGFIRALGLGRHGAAVSPDPDGSFAFEWFKGPDWQVSVTVGNDGVLYWAAIFGETRSFGKAPFRGRIDPKLLELIDQVSTMLRSSHGVD